MALIVLFAVIGKLKDVCQEDKSVTPVKRLGLKTRQAPPVRWETQFVDINYVAFATYNCMLRVCQIKVS